MTRIPMSPAASALLRLLTARAGVARDRILLTDAHSTDWRSLTFTGERHHLSLRIPGPGSRDVVRRMCAGLEDAEFSIPGLMVADIGLVGTPTASSAGSTELTIEALTISED
jgi:hypothetical protein